MAKFLQSKNDFPLTVSLGNKAPDWGLSRWNRNARLCFIPPCDEGFTLRGDRRRLIYKGRRRSHRFTILGDGAFEYDCILEREPESNVIALRMEGAEGYDFYRQPDFIKDPLLAGSYAVYKKETLIGEGTGKLCHIHRPEIIDAGGRRCWGDLVVAGNCLLITIPEQWLGEAKYPVVVDPVIGTTSIGTQFSSQMFTDKIMLYKYILPERLTGKCTGYIYNCNVYSNGLVYFGIFSDNNNTPHTLQSKKESYGQIRLMLEEPPKWVSATFEMKDSIARDSYVWFAAKIRSFNTMYDFSENETITVPQWRFWDTKPLEESDIVQRLQRRYSMYFEYTSAPGQDYYCFLNSNISLMDNLKRKGYYKRNNIDNIKSIGNIGISSFFARFLLECKNPVDTTKIQKIITRLIVSRAKGIGQLNNKANYIRSESIRIGVKSNIGKSINILIRIISNIFAREKSLWLFLKAKEEIRIKSCISREIILNSKIQ